MRVGIRLTGRFTCALVVALAYGVGLEVPGASASASPQSSVSSVVQTAESMGGPFATNNSIATLEEATDPDLIPRGTGTAEGNSNPAPTASSTSAAPPFAIPVSSAPVNGALAYGVSSGAATPAVTPIATYGLSGDTCTTIVGSSYHFCDYQSSAKASLVSGLGIRVVRFGVPWDAVDTYNPSTGKCVYNENSSGAFNETDYSGNSDFEDLLRFAQAAQDDGFQPMIVLTVGNAVGTAGGVQEPYFPQATSAHGYGGTGDYQYACGFDGLAYLLHGFGINVPYWEVWNEPDALQGNSGTNVNYNIAANYYTDAYDVEKLLGYNDRIIAGSFADSALEATCCSYVENYLSDLGLNIATLSLQYPFAIAGHPYDDADSSGVYETPEHQLTANLINLVNAYLENGAYVWLTEVGVWLNDPNSDGEGGELGADVNSSPLEQAYAAQGVKSLASYSQQIIGVNYYELATTGDAVNAGSDNYDSALLGLDSPSFDQSANPASNGGPAVPRASFCVLAYGDSPTAAVSDSRCDTPNNSGQNVSVPEGGVEGWCATSGNPSTPVKTPAGESCAAAGDIVGSGSCGTKAFPSVTIGAPWTNWAGNRQYAYENCSGQWSYAGLGS